MEPIVRRRLLLSKEFYLHAVERLTAPGPIDRLMAVHNLHIAVEILLRAIMLHYQIRTEKTLNIDFESMLSEINNFQVFKNSGKKLPLRQEIRNLNQVRNLAQHHATEPNQASLDDCRVYTKDFLVHVFMEYFQVDFFSLSRATFIDDEILRKLIKRSTALIKESQLEEAAMLLATSFEYGSASLCAFLPDEGLLSSFFSHEPVFKELSDAIETVFDRIRRTERFAAILSSGLSLVALKRFEKEAPAVVLSFNGKPWTSQKGNQTYDTETVAWMHDFVTDAILRWQYGGLMPAAPEQFVEEAKKLLKGHPVDPNSG